MNGIILGEIDQEFLDRLPKMTDPIWDILKHHQPKFGQVVHAERLDQIPELLEEGYLTHPSKESTRYQEIRVDVSTAQKLTELSAQIYMAIKHHSGLKDEYALVTTKAPSTKMIQSQSLKDARKKALIYRAGLQLQKIASTYGCNYNIASRRVVFTPGDFRFYLGETNELKAIKSCILVDFQEWVASPEALQIIGKMKSDESQQEANPGEWKVSRTNTVINLNDFPFDLDYNPSESLPGYCEEEIIPGYISVYTNREDFPDI